MSENEKQPDNSGFASNALLSDALDATGFEKCEFGPDNDPCEKCGNKNRQLYFGNRGYWDSREGDYYCSACLIELSYANNEPEDIQDIYGWMPPIQDG